MTSIEKQTITIGYVTYEVERERVCDQNVCDIMLRRIKRVCDKNAAFDKKCHEAV